MSREQDRWDAGEASYKAERDESSPELAAAKATLPKLQGKNRALLESAVEKLSQALAKRSISPTLSDRGGPNVQR